MEIPGKMLVVIVLGSAILGGVIERGVSGKDTLTAKTTDDTLTRKKIITKIKEHTNTDGSKDREIVIDDGSVIKEDKRVIVVETKSIVKDWYVHGGAGVRVQHLERVYSLGVDRRILGPIWLGVYANTQEEVGLHVGLQF